jgi:hypothetical protein
MNKTSMDKGFFAYDFGNLIFFNEFISSKPVEFISACIDFAIHPIVAAMRNHDLAALSGRHPCGFPRLD